MKPTKHYVDNEQFLQAMRVWRQACIDAEHMKADPPPVPEYIGECFMAIAKHMSSKPNFAGYSYREDMVSEAIENCLNYARNFDPDISSSPFAYFSQIVYFAFIRKIQKERKQTYIRYKMLEQMVIDGSSATPGVDGSTAVSDPTTLNFDNVQDFIKRFDAYTSGKRAKRASKTPRLA